MVAVVITASSRPGKVQARPRAGLDCASSRQRCSVPTSMPTSLAITSAAAPSGGSNRATARSLNVCPYRATDVLHRRPQGSWSYEGDNYCDAGGNRPCEMPCSRRIRLPYAMPQPAAFRAGSMCAARVSASFIVLSGNRLHVDGEWHQ